MLHVFIDTNIFLEFYAFAKDDLDELRKVRSAIEGDGLKLWVPEQVSDELHRRREEKIAESQEALKKLMPSGTVPQLAANLPAFDALQDARRDYSAHLNEMQDRVVEDAASKSFAADSVLNELMQVATTIDVTPGILGSARDRVDRGNPPGKKGSLGDAINWECLLSDAPNGEAIFVISADRDFASPVEPDKPSGFLADEWRARKDGASLALYKRISSFFQDHFPESELAPDVEREARVRSLVSSPNFSETHERVDRLSGYSRFTDSQARELFEALLSNSQIRWIARDDDVCGFFSHLLTSSSHVLEEEQATEVRELLEEQDNPDPPIDADDDDFPF